MVDHHSATLMAARVTTNEGTLTCTKELKQHAEFLGTMRTHTSSPGRMSEGGSGDNAGG